MGRNSVTGGARRASACVGHYNWRGPNRDLVTQGSAGSSEAKVFRAHAPPQGACENLVRALKSGWEVAALCRCPLKLSSSSAKQRGVRMDELRRFIKVDKHEAVKIGGL